MITILVFILSVIRMGTDGTPLIKTEEINPSSGIIRIVGGVEATPHSLPYHVGLIIASQYFCGAVLISSEHVLTAAHCVSSTGSSIEVILGAHNINCYEDTQKVLYNPVVIVHQNYNENLYIHDIALLKLSKHVELTGAIKPIRNLADDDSGNFIGCNGLLSGWGYTSTSKHIESRLRQVNLDIISNYRCNSIIHAEGVAIIESQLCTDGNDSMIGSVGGCFGDSGSPLVVGGTTLVGLVSVGFSSCNAGFPTVYTRISYFRNWIAKYSGI